MNGKITFGILYVISRVFVSNLWKCIYLYQFSLNWTTTGRQDVDDAIRKRCQKFVHLFSYVRFNTYLHVDVFKGCINNN